jgi:hypothetical protein
MAAHSGDLKLEHRPDQTVAVLTIPVARAGEDS